MRRAFYSRMRGSCASLLLVAAACGGARERPADARSPRGGERALGEMHYLAGEHMEWEVRWAGVLVGRVQLATGQPGMVEGKRVLVVRSLMVSDGALAVAKRGQMELVTWIDLDRRAPMAQAGSFDQIYTGEVLGTQFGAAEWPRTPWLSGLRDGEVAQSTHTALGLLRGWRARSGDRAHLFVRVRSRVLRIDLTATGRERVTSALGRRSALRIDGTAVPVDDSLAPMPGQHVFPTSFWIDDEGSERVPVRIEIESGYGGIVRLDLVTYDAPASYQISDGKPSSADPRALRASVASRPWATVVGKWRSLRSLLIARARPGDAR